MFIYYRYRILILVLTFITYMFYHMSRRPLTVTKTKFIDCPESDETTTIVNELVRQNVGFPKVLKIYIQAFIT